jgi:hypothetical protein
LLDWTRNQSRGMWRQIVPASTTMPHLLVEPLPVPLPEAVASETSEPVSAGFYRSFLGAKGTAFANTVPHLGMLHSSLSGKTSEVSAAVQTSKIGANFKSVMSGL